MHNHARQSKRCLCIAALGKPSGIDGVSVDFAARMLVVSLLLIKHVFVHAQDSVPLCSMEHLWGAGPGAQLAFSSALACVKSGLHMSRHLVHVR